MTTTSFVPNIGWVPPGNLVDGTQCESFGADPGRDANSNTNAINKALSVGGLVTLYTPGTYTVACSTPRQTPDGNTYNVALLIPSNTTLFLGGGVIIKAAPGVNNPVLIQNQNISSGDNNIEIAGGKWDGFGAAQTVSSAAHGAGAGSFCSILHWYQNITNFKLHDTWVADPPSSSWGIALSNMVDFRVWNIDRIDSAGFVASRNSPSNQDGIDLVGPMKDGYIGNVFTNVMSDCIAFLADQASHSNSGYVSTMAGYGAQSNIVVENIRSRGSDGVFNHLRLLDSTTNPISNVVVRGIVGPFIETVAKIGSDSITGNVSLLRDIAIENVNVTAMTSGAVAAMKITGSAESLYFRNLMYTISTNAPATPLIQVTTIASVPSVSSMVVDGFTVKNLQNAGASWFHFANGSVDVANICNGSIVNQGNGGLGSGNFAFTVLGATTNRLNISNCIANNISRFIALDGITSSVALQGNHFYGPSTSTFEAIRIRGTVPNLRLIANDINMIPNGSAGVTTGVINLNGSVGTTTIYAWGNNLRNNNTTVVRNASEVIRWNGLDAPINSTIIASLIGDVFVDSNSGFGIICTSAAQGYRQL